MFFFFFLFLGYDLAAEGGVKAMLDEFDLQVGLHYLKAIHLNDSKGAARNPNNLTQPNGLFCFKNCYHLNVSVVVFFNSCLCCVFF